ncbi:MAG: Caspase domain-containing protein [Candidatus Kentron sp. G]|nr:MAG: Caspase domain-containing protein [Candidatus Kentron sp. G]VFN04631.1 MAG: Caspase domain-containing protein [Candidatus Kentron sp. G]VFN05435.1 MAG: Caspase domain-containing protein [Candidatus Kentron sp. G]
MEKFALLIGVGRYPATDLPPLPAAARDIHALDKVLRHPEMGGFAGENVILLEDPGRQAMAEAIERLFSGRNKDDLVLLYFSGHGLKDDTGSLYLATAETRRRPNGELARASAVTAGAVREEMERSRARRQIIILVQLRLSSDTTSDR